MTTRRFSEPQKRHTPQISLDLDEMQLTIKGYSIPEDVTVFYTPLVEFLEQNAQHISSNNRAFSLLLDLEYFNSASLKFFMKLIGMLISIKGKPNLAIDYYYDQEDDDFHETGVDISTSLNIPINFISR